MTHDLSLGEVQALCVKATRGAGRAVGVAEDAGRAVRWLCARGEDGAGALVALLQATDGAPPAELAPRLPDLAAAGRALCPLALGGYLSDMGDLPADVIGPLWEVTLLQPFLADLAPMGVDVTPQGDPAFVRVSPREAALAPTHSRAVLAPETLHALLDFAARTYAPATEQSRVQGAGAGLSDND